MSGGFVANWLISLTLAIQAAPAPVQELCAGSRLTLGNLGVSVSLKQVGEAKPFADYIHFRALSKDGTLELSAAYVADAAGSLTPHSFSVQTRPQRPPEDRTRETVRWRLADGAWASYPYSLNPDQRGNYDFRIAQSGGPGLSFRTEWLERLPKGGRFSVMRVTEKGEELGTGSVDYPGAALIAEVFAEARTLALAKLAPCKRPAGFVRPAPSD